MSGDPFSRFEEVLAREGPKIALEDLAGRLRDDKSYPQLFEARLMAKRFELGLPLIDTDNGADLPDEIRKNYDQAFIDAAREVGRLFLADGNVERAWPYLRVTGETASIREAIEKLTPDQCTDGILEIALGERVHPRKAFELILGSHGICRAITFYHQYPDRKTRLDCLRLLVRTLYADLAENLKRAIERAGDTPPDTRSVRELITGRDWLFGEHSYYVDSSHLGEIVRFSADLDDPDTLRLSLELAEYGRCLSPMFQYRGDPPFEDVYGDHAIFFRALLGEDQEQAIEHFRRKIVESDPEQAGTAPAQVLVSLLARLGRYNDAISASLEHLRETPRSQLVCPSVLELCQLAGDYSRLKELARDQDDVLGFAAGALKSA